MMSSAVADDGPLLAGLSGEDEPTRKSRWWGRLIDLQEARIQVQLAIPMVLTNVSYYAIPLVSVMFAGHLGELELAGSTLANSWASVTGFALTVGLSGALETLCGQGYGAKLYRMLGIYLQSSLMVSFLVSALVSILWFYTEQVLILLHQDPEVSKMAAVYMKNLIPGLFAYAFLQCLLRFLQTQRVVIPLVVCSLVPLVLHVGITYLLVHVWALGFKGSSLAASISLWISFLMLASYVHLSSRFRYTWEGMSLESFMYVLPNMKLAIPSAIMVCLEFWAFEFLVLLAGLLPNSERSTSLIAMCVTTEAVIYNVTFGFSAAVSTRVSNELGARNSDKARNAVAVTLKLSIGLALVIVMSLLLGHDLWAKLFTDSALIITEFAYMTPLLAASLLLDSAQGILSGVARGCGWQHLAAWTNLAAFYVIGMPLSIVFGFMLSLLDKGLWMGLICGLFSQASILLFITLRTNWSKLELSVDDKQSDEFLC